MKRCGKCGAVQDESRSTCIDCGAVLPKPMTDAEMAAYEEAVDDTQYDMAEKTEPFFVTRWARILGIASIVCFAGALLFLLLSPQPSVCMKKRIDRNRKSPDAKIPGIFVLYSCRTWIL